MNKQLTWRHLKALHQLYTLNRTDAKITDNNYITNVLIGQKKLLKPKFDNIKITEAVPKFKNFYEENFQQNYERCSQFLQNQELEDDARRKYTEEDIQALIFIAEYKEELTKNLTTIRTFSSEIFKGHGSKYLENRPGLKKAVCKILEITDFPDKDPKNHQYRFVVDCLEPKAVILCENLAHLKNAWKARENSIELWYVGGNNIGIIDHIGPDKLSKPLYYSCDWDYHGLSIYSRIKSRLKIKSFDIKLLRPFTYETALPTNSPYHYSLWDINNDLSGLNGEDFNAKEKQFIKKLIIENKWIEEESMDFVSILELAIQYKNA